MLDSLKQLWRWLSELDTVVSVANWLKVGVGVMTGLVAGFWGWLNSQPGSILFILFLSACLIAIWLVNGVVWLRQQRAFKQGDSKATVTTSFGDFSDIK